ncbi:hypothetical protein HNR62_001499 [Oceanisphaera litoralis]|uniref:hypothetical protein n=1 Tax=Oceanisphaera litoralis TaxID=225144 RepID=UPI00195E84AA|nr:hypothetical protein [Oceanisphaera litoralis]MBM7455627.1 hypothetical protein [Oceanisphaera litoralis]
MKKLVRMLMVTAVMAGPVLADSHQSQSGAHRHGAMMGMMNQEQMQTMHQHMEKMQALMAEINQESDPEKRRALMQTHRQSMREGMQMMKGQGGMGSGRKGMSPMGMEERMGMMEQRMNMMHMMMEQMMDHDVAEER